MSIVAVFLQEYIAAKLSPSTQVVKVIGAEMLGVQCSLITRTVLTVDGTRECPICKGSVVELPNNWKRAA